MSSKYNKIFKRKKGSQEEVCGLGCRGELEGYVLLCFSSVAINPMIQSSWAGKGLIRAVLQGPNPSLREIRAGTQVWT